MRKKIYKPLASVLEQSPVVFETQIKDHKLEPNRGQVRGLWRSGESDQVSHRCIKREEMIGLLD